MTGAARICSRPTCRNYADVTLTYDYEDRMMAVGPLLQTPTDGGYDLCDVHASRLRPPSGWTVVQHRPIDGEGQR